MAWHAAGIDPVIALEQAYAESEVRRSLTFRGDRCGSRWLVHIAQHLRELPQFFRIQIRHSPIRHVILGPVEDVIALTIKGPDGPIRLGRGPGKKIDDMLPPAVH